MKILAIGLVLSLVGCGTWYAPNRGVASVPCASKADCDYKWSRAQVAVTKYSGYRIQLANDNVIETFGPTRSGSGLAYRVTKEVDRNGIGAIQIRALCNATVYGCVEDPLVGAEGVAAYLRAG